MPELRSVRELSSWLSIPAAETFPYDVVVDAYQRAGKHFVAKELLEALHDVRLRLAEIPGAGDASGLLTRFLEVALDKRDERYDYRTYLALSLLPLLGPDSPLIDADGESQRQHDRLLAHLIADTMRFELDVLDGHCDLMPRMRPDAQTTMKRLRLASRVVQSVLDRLGLTQAASTAVPSAPTEPSQDSTAAARRLLAAVAADMTAADRRTLRLSMLPVWIAHDEYMFIRVLQAFETTFALLAVRMRTAIAALGDREPAVATAAVAAAERSLSETARAFSLMATMQVESFQTFRQYTEGASAIQSRNYKIVESLCARPERSRLNSPGYLSVPDVRERLIDGQANLDDLVAAAHGDWLTPGSHAELIAAMQRFESTLLQWRQTHYRLAVRMLGDRAGTGYTEGTPYLKSTRAIRVFSISRPE